MTFSAAVLDTVPYLLFAVQVNTPESSGKTSAMTRVHISSRGKGRKDDTHIIRFDILPLHHINVSQCPSAAEKHCMTCSNTQQRGFSGSLVLRVCCMKLRQVEVICHGGLTQDEKLPYMVQIQGKAALAYVQKKSRSLRQGL